MVPIGYVERLLNRLIVKSEEKLAGYWEAPSSSVMMCAAETLLVVFAKSRSRVPPTKETWSSRRNEWSMVHRLGEDRRPYSVTRSRDASQAVVRRIQGLASKPRSEAQQQIVRYRVTKEDWRQASIA